MVTVPRCALAFVLCSFATCPWAATAVFAPCSCAAFLLAVHMQNPYWGLTVLMGSDHYQQKTCLSLPPTLVLTVGSWFTAGDPMIHMCKDYKLASVQHLPLINACSNQCRQHHKQEQPVGSLIGSWWKQDRCCERCIGGRQPAALVRMPRVGCPSLPSWLLERDSVSLFSLSFCCTFFTKVNLTITVNVCH